MVLQTSSSLDNALYSADFYAEWSIRMIERAQEDSQKYIVAAITTYAKALRVLHEQGRLQLPSKRFIFGWDQGLNMGEEPTRYSLFLSPEAQLITVRVSHFQFYSDKPLEGSIEEEFNPSTTLNVYDHRTKNLVNENILHQLRGIYESFKYSFFVKEILGHIPEHFPMQN